MYDFLLKLSKTFRTMSTDDLLAYEQAVLDMESELHYKISLDNATWADADEAEQDRHFGSVGIIDLHVRWLTMSDLLDKVSTELDMRRSEGL